MATETDIFDAPPAVAARATPLSLEPQVDQPVALHRAHQGAVAHHPEVVDTGVDALIRVALQSGADVEKLTSLYRLKKEWEADEDKRVALLKMAAFKRNAPQMFKDKHVKFETQKGITEYDHATLGAICDTIVASLAEYDITHSWDPKTLQGNRVSVTCKLEYGLWERVVTLEADYDMSGGKNVIQGQGSAITYLERYSLLAAVGLAVKGMPDDDGRGTAAIANTQAIIGEQILGGLLTQLQATTTDAAALAVWKIGLPTLKATKSIAAVDEFRQRVESHRVSLREAA